MTEEQLKNDNIRVVRKYRKIPNVDANKGELQQVFLNMVTNARDAMLHKGGTLEIGIKKVKDSVEIKEFSSKIKVIMMTGSLMKKSFWREFKQKGASGFIQKPFKIEDIKKFL